ncbi:MAG: hypothetical protein FRX48_08492 [Lasallia pustulata]|uniref:PI31 proteasome regulator N-terminal domain-containing protein n=1 Tax=Lasallia pustulata TaxID=136370 RepID=A0A5M8PFD7_9LECA|nr:MAG: hypothetical protein FRX48_08492 [Lasallia pustulata]
MDVNSGNPLSSGSLATFMASSLPTETPPHVRDPYDAVALFSHACMISIGFRLIGLGEDHKIEATREASDPYPLPQAWNATSTSTYAFRYAHTQSSLEYLIKITRLGHKAVINALGIGDDRVHSLDLHIKDFFLPARFPFTAPSTPLPPPPPPPPSPAPSKTSSSPPAASPTSAPSSNSASSKKSPRASTNPATKIPPPPAPETSSSRGAQTPIHARDPPHHEPPRDDRAPPARPYPFDDPLAAAPRRAFPPGDFPPPGFEDEYEIGRPAGTAGVGGERRPLRIGERDLYPPGLGPRDPLNGGGGGRWGGGLWL